MANVDVHTDPDPHAPPVKPGENDKPPDADKDSHGGFKASKYFKPVIAIALLAVVGVAAYFVWQHFRAKGLGEGFASGNGRIEGVEFNVAAKAPGRIRDMYVDEGDLVIAGQVVARMDTAILRAQLKQAQADEAQARNATSTAMAMVALQQSQRSAEVAMVAQREAELAVDEKTAERARILSRQHAMSMQELDEDLARQRVGAAAVVAAKAQLAASQSRIDAASFQVLGARSNIAAMQASEAQIQTQIDDAALTTARSGRVQYRIAQPGEVVGAGGKVLGLVDLSDMSITFFLPEAAVGRVAIGSEVRVVLDATPDNVIPANISFVANVAQFTPKSVETKSEREKLVFRVKAKIGTEILRQNNWLIKSGVPGVAYVRLDPAVPWPAKLTVRSAR